MKNNKNIMELRGMELDDLIFEYQQKTDLTELESQVLLKADVAYLQDDEKKAASLMDQLVSHYTHCTIVKCDETISSSTK